MELNLEHEYVCRVHKVNLRPVAITLFDSESRWGEFDAPTRTISISRKLIQDHPWEAVIGVFRHEMAHQLAHEQSYQNREERPHGEDFKKACSRLGVPEQFAQAGIDLASYSFNWRGNARSDDTGAMLDKVKKLLALAGSANEHEALLAMEKVRALYSKYNLELNDSEEKAGFIHLVLSSGKKGLQPWFLRIASILSEHFFVRTLTFRQFEPKTGGRVGAIEVIGRRENVLMAEYVFHFLIHQLDHLVENQKKTELGLARQHRTSFRLGILDGFSKKLEVSKKSRSKTEAASDLPGARDLTVIGQALEKFENDQKIDDYINEIYPRLGRRSEGSLQINGEAFMAGHAVGANINLNKPMESKTRGGALPAPKAKLLKN